MTKSEREKQELITALDKALKLLESTVSWAEAREFTDDQEYIQWEDRINQLSVKDHKINFANFSYLD